MGFLDNSGDIILDAVLTDHGRKVLAKGDGSFQITKFALGDEEINYSLYNKNHASGSAYYDLEILQSPVLEAFTDNAASMKTKLITLDNQNLLYMPVLKENVNLQGTKKHSKGAYLIAVDRETEGTDAAETSAAIGTNSTGHVEGIMYGQSGEDSNYIRIDQGLDTTEISPKQRSAIGDLIEGSYIIQLDSRLGRIVDLNNNPIPEDYIDDDQIAYYTVDRSDGIVMSNEDDTKSSSQTIKGPRGSMLTFKIAASLELQTSTFLFNQLGGTDATMTNRTGATQSVRYIDSICRVTGMTTGYSIDVQIRYVKTITT